MCKFIFIAGGAKSGKSRFCIELARSMGSSKVLFIATCIPQDQEMKKRVSEHKKRRPRQWKVIEEGIYVKKVLEDYRDVYDVIIIDCLGLFISNLMSKKKKTQAIYREVRDIAQILTDRKALSIVVSNEVGEGIVPTNATARRFRDILGLSNQIMSKYADTVYSMHMGIPVKIK